MVFFLYKKIVPFLTCIFSGILAGGVFLFPVPWGWKIVLAAGIILLNVCFLFRFCGLKSVLRLWIGDPEASGSSRGSEEAILQRDEIESLTHELDRICTEIDSLKGKIEYTYSKTEEKIYCQTTALHTIIRKLRRDANQDSMTGLANRRHFGHYSHRLFEQARQNGTDLVCIMIDIDQFKMVNDQFSHVTGDCVIVMIGELLKASVRQGDLCARFGGDEFIMLLQNCSAGEAWHIAERIRQSFVQKAVQIIQESMREKSIGGISAGFEEKDLSHITGLSVGIASLRKNRPDNLVQFIKMADQALYLAKRSGKTAVCPEPTETDPSLI